MATGNRWPSILFEPNGQIRNPLYLLILVECARLFRAGSGSG